MQAQLKYCQLKSACAQEKTALIVLILMHVLALAMHKAVLTAVLLLKLKNHHWLDAMSLGESE